MGKKKQNRLATGRPAASGKNGSNGWTGPHKEQSEPEKQPEPPIREQVERLTNENAKLNRQVAGLQDQVVTDLSQLRDSRAHAKALEGENALLREELDEMRQWTKSEVVIDPRLVECCHAAMREPMTLSLALRLLEVMYPRRIVVLESARSSADKASGFEEIARACELMVKFATEYWEALSAGGPAANGLAIFGTRAFSPRESETVEKNRRARALRTFEYKGKELLMLAHLKVGVRRDETTTWRMHFYWDAGAKKLVIGHCGKHLDHN